MRLTLVSRPLKLGTMSDLGSHPTILELTVSPHRYDASNRLPCMLVSTRMPACLPLHVCVPARRLPPPHPLLLAGGQPQPSSQHQQNTQSAQLTPQHNTARQQLARGGGRRLVSLSSGWHPLPMTHSCPPSGNAQLWQAARPSRECTATKWQTQLACHSFVIACWGIGDCPHPPQGAY